MITAEPYLNEYQLYHMLPIEDRWIFNKLTVAERMGYVCGPVGTTPDTRGKYIVRPIMSISGMGNGGFFLRDTTQPGTAGIDKDQTPNANPGYFWVEEFTGHHNWTSYINDVPMYGTVGIRNGNDIKFTDDTNLTESIPLPDIFKGISRYMMLEHIGGNVIEISPRHTSGYARQETVDDYLIIDPNYDPYIEFGLTDWELADDPAGGKRWVSIETTRKPY